MEVLEQPSPVLEFTAGDLFAFETLFRQHQQEVYAWIVRDPLWRKIPRSRPSGVSTAVIARFDRARSFGAWARKIATNVALDYLKSSQARRFAMTGEDSTEN